MFMSDLHKSCYVIKICIIETKEKWQKSPKINSVSGFHMTPFKQTKILLENKARKQQWLTTKACYLCLQGNAYYFLWKISFKYSNEHTKYVQTC